MKAYVEAFRADGTRILGNLDGQCVFARVDTYRRTNAYRRLVREDAARLSLNGCAARYDIVTDDGRVLESIRKGGAQ